jgi:hypothetical protein
LFEDEFARLQRVMLIPEDGIIPDRPDSPEHCNNYFDRERPVNLSFEHRECIFYISLD